MASITQGLIGSGLITGEWYGWVQENVTRQCSPEEILSILIANGFEADLSARTLAFVLENPTLPAAAVEVLTNPLNDGELITGEWYGWVQENVQRECDANEILSVLIANGYEAELAKRTILFVQQNPTLTLPESSFSGSTLPKPKTMLDLSFGSCESLIQIEKPMLLVYRNFMSEDECDELICMSNHKLKRSTTIGDLDGKEIVHEHRTSEGTFFQRGEPGFIQQLEERAADLMNLPIDNGEGIQILRYASGGEYRPHYDYFPVDKPGSLPHIAKGGQRVATLIMYLSTVEEGGETIFPKLNLKVAAKKGQAVYFSYFDPTTGSVDPLSLHGGAPVIRGEKWIATKWVRERLYK